MEIFLDNGHCTISLENSIVIPEPKIPHAKLLNDFCPSKLTSVLCKCM